MGLVLTTCTNTWFDFWLVQARPPRLVLSEIYSFHNWLQGRDYLRYLESNFVKISMLSIVRSVGVCHLDSEKLHNARRMSLSEPSLYLLPCVSGVHFRLDNLNCHRRVASRHPPVIKMQKLSDFTLKVSITSLPFDVPHSVSSPLASFNSI